MQFTTKLTIGFAVLISVIGIGYLFPFVRGVLLVIIPLSPPILGALYFFHLRHMKFIKDILSGAKARRKPRIMPQSFKNPYMTH